MGTTTSYFLNAPSLGSATSIYVDAAMTLYAPNGFYQQDNISRELVDGVLLPQQTCASCAYPCSDYPIDQAVDEGVYKININIGSSLGAVIITVNPESVPSGFFVEYNSAIYNAFSSPAYGYLAASSGATFLGRTADDCGIVSGSPHTLSEYRYNGADFDATGNTEVITVVAGQIETTTNNPGDCKMVIPKTAVSPSTLEMTIYSTCPYSVFSVEISCPALLTSFSSSIRRSDSTVACDSARGQTYYVAHVNGSLGTLGLYDWVFSDAYGQNPLSNGYYGTTASTGWIRVENGTIIQTGTC